MKQSDIKELLNNNKKIELVSFSKKAGFTKEQAQLIINQLIEAFNHETTDDYINIKINRFEMQINNDKKSILYTLNKFNAKIQKLETIKENNKIFNQLKNNYSNKCYLIDNTYLSDGNIAINKKYVGDLLAINENNYIFENKAINELTGNNLIKADNYIINENIKCKKTKYTIFTKNSDFIVFNQKYFDLIKKQCKKNKIEFYFTENKQTLLFYDTENYKIIGLIMSVLIKNKSDLDLEMIQKNENNNNIDDKTTINQLLNPNALEKMIDSKELINKESEQIMTKKQINAVTKHVYNGNNAIELEKAGFNSNEWVGSGQAKKLGKQVKKDAKGVVIKVYKENEDGQTFCKLETIYNIEELEEIKKVENTSQFKDMVNRFKNMFVRKRA